MNKIIESVNVKLAPGISEETFLRACKGVEPFLKRQPGFLSRRIARMEEGRYIDILEWRSQEEADKAMALSMQEPGMAAIMETIDAESMVVSHHRVVAEM
jgi:heme-degrading monooxygenase HmoA